MPRFSLADLPERYQAEVARQIAPKSLPEPRPLAITGRKEPDGVKAIIAAPAPRSGQEIRLTLPYPPSTNAAWRSVVIKGRVRVLLSKQGRLFKKAVAALAKGCTPLDGPVSLTVYVHRPMKRGDLSNRIKILEDALQGFAYRNDDQIVHIVAWRWDDKVNPRVEVVVRPAG